jgi:hypothetical protein
VSQIDPSDIDDDLKKFTVALNAAMEHCPPHTSSVIKAVAEPLLTTINYRLLREAKLCPAPTATE